MEETASNPGEGKVGGKVETAGDEGKATGEEAPEVPPVSAAVAAEDEGESGASPAVVAEDESKSEGKTDAEGKDTPAAAAPSDPATSDDATGAVVESDGAAAAAIAADDDTGDATPEVMPAALPPPPPAGSWGKSAASTRPANESSKEKRERERRERDQERLSRSAKFGGKNRSRSRSPARKQVNGKGAGKLSPQQKESLAAAKKREAMARFNPAQQKLLRRLQASKDYWVKTRPSTAAKKKRAEEKASAKQKAQKGSGKGAGGKSGVDDVWRAVETGDLEFVKSHVQHSRWDVRRHHDRGPGGYGATALHKACWGCHPSLVKWLLEHVERRYGVAELKKYVNCTDSHASRVTPLIEAARTRVGFLPDRLEVLRLLFAAGADLRHKDVHGDNCLHWASRMGALPIVRYLLTMTEGAVWASMDENVLRKRPIDIALERCCERVEVLSTDDAAGTAAVRIESANVGRSDSVTVQLDDLFPLPLEGAKKKEGKPVMLLATHAEYARDAVYAQLLKMVQGSNVRLKIQRNRERREAEKRRKAQKIQDERDSIIELARSSAMDAQVEWLRQRQEAERIRQEDEDKHVHKITSNAISEAKKFVDTREGKAEIKLRARKIEKDRRDQAKMNGEPAPKRIGKQCQAQARTDFIAEREQEARTQAKRDFRRKNPSNFDKRERKAIETANKKEAARRLTVLRELDQRLKDDIDMDTGLCSEPHLNLNKFCASYTGW